MSDSAPSPIGNHLPTPTQKLLLKTILGPSEQLIGNWQSWQRMIALDDIDHGSFRIIPMLYHILRQQDVEGPDIQRYAGMSRKAWYKNKLLFHRTTQLIRQWQSEGRQLAVIKGFALSHLYYPDPGLRPMDDADILVPVDQAIPSINWFFENGWSHSEGVSHEALVKYSIHKVHSADMRHTSGSTIDAHWQLLHYPMPPVLLNELWEAMTTVEILGLEMKTLCPTDHLLHTCFHGFGWNPVPPLRWIIDAHFILEKDRAQIDWKRLLRFTHQLQIGHIIKPALAYLRNEFQEPIPQDVLNQIEKHPLTKWQQSEYQLWVTPEPRAFLNHCLHQQYKRLQATLPEWQAKPSWRAKADYLKLHWELDSDLQLLSQTVHRTFRKIWSKLAG